MGNKNIVLWFLVFTVFLDLFLYGSRFINFEKIDKYRPNKKIIDFLNKDRGFYRVLIYKPKPSVNLISINGFSVSGILNPDGYDPIILSRYGMLGNAVNNWPPERLETVSFPISNICSPLINLLAVKYIITGPAINLTESPCNFELLKEDRDYNIFLNKRFSPLAFAVANYETAAGPMEAFEKIRQPDFNFREKVILESVKENLPPEKTDKFSSQVKITNFSNNRREIDVDLNDAGFLVLLENYFPGWTAKTDGQETDIFPANLYAKAVVVPPGRHKIVFSYEPLKRYRPGFLITGLVAIGVAVSLAKARKKAR